MLRRKQKLIACFLTMVLTVLIFPAGCQPDSAVNGTDENENMEVHVEENGEIVSLDEPVFAETLYIEETLEKRRSIRSYQDEPLDLVDVSRLTWAAQGITEPGPGFRTAPSAGATYPLDIYIVADNVDGLSPGIYHYIPEKHQLEKIVSGKLGHYLKDYALGQRPVAEAPMNIVITAEYARVTGRYGDRGVRYAKLEAGHVSQNIYLQCTALELGTVAIGAFDDGSVRELLQLDEGHTPLYIMPVGKK